jgi:hypothetical protein
MPGFISDSSDRRAIGPDGLSYVSLSCLRLVSVDDALH